MKTEFEKMEQCANITSAFFSVGQEINVRKGHNLMLFHCKIDGFF